jgi:fatty-acid desaturase
MFLDNFGGKIILYEPHTKCILFFLRTLVSIFVQILPRKKLKTKIIAVCLVQWSISIASRTAKIIAQPSISPPAIAHRIL